MLKEAKDLRSQNIVAKVVHDTLIVYEKERGNDIFEAQGDPLIAFKLKLKGCRYLKINVNKRSKFKI